MSGFAGNGRWGVAMASPDKFALVVRWAEELGPEAIAERFMSDADVVLCEGFKRSSLPRVEVFREAAHATPLYDASADDALRYLAVVTDREMDPDPLLAGVPTVVRLSDDAWLERLATLVEDRVMGGVR